MTPTTALNRFASDNRKHNLYLNEPRAKMHYGFRTGSLKFLLKPLEKVEVIEAVPTCPVPNTPGWFAGMINLRGDLVPVFDINFLITKIPASTKWIMVFRHGRCSAGIYIDTLPYAINPDTGIYEQPVIPEILQECVENVYGQNDDIWLETDFEKFFLGLRTRF